MGGEWPLLGRDEDLRRANAALRDHRGVLLAGPAGVGKTRLATEFAASKGAVITLRANAATRSFAFGAVAPLLTGTDPTDGVRSLAQVLRAATSTVAARTADGPLMLLVDDVQLLDEGSAVVVAELIRSHVGGVLTQREGGTVHDAVQSLWRDGTVERLDLAPLADDAMAELLEAALDGRAELATAERLLRLAAGNPFHLRELIRSGVDHGGLRRSGTAWRLDRRFDASPRLVELVTATVAGLDRADAELLRLVAFGEPLPLAWLSRPEYFASLGELEGRQLLTVEPAGPGAAVSLAHPLYAEVLRSAATVVNRTEAQAELVMLAESSAAVLRPNDIMRVALWRLRSGLPADPAAVLQAAARARVVENMKDALELARAAVMLGAGPLASYLLGEILDYYGRADEALSVLGAAQPQTEEQLAVVGMAMADATFWGRNDPGAAAAITAQALAALHAERWRDSVLAQQARHHAYAGRYREALSLSEPLVDHDEPRVAADACLPSLVAHLNGGDTATAVARGERASQLRGTIEDELQVTGIEVHRSFLALALAENGQVNEAVQRARADLATALALGRPGAAWCALSLARICLLSGDLDQTSHLAGDLVDLVVLNSYAYRTALTHAALADAARGERVRASGWLDRLAAAPPSAITTFALEERRAWAWLAIAGGELAAGVDELDTTADAALAAGQRTIAASALHDIVRCGDARRAAARTAALAAVVDGRLMAARALHTAGAAERQPETVAEAADAFEACGALLFAAEAAADAATLWQQGERQRQATAARRRSQELQDRCRGAATPALRVAAPVVPLSPREREVALLVAEGYTSPEIAARLGRSRRTVETHLQNTFLKLGVSSRHELAEALKARV